MPNPPEFDLTISPVDAGYTVQLRAAFGVDLPAQPFALPFDLAALPHQRIDAAEWVAHARVARLRGTEELRQARAFGQALFERLFSGGILTALRESRAALPAGERLRLRLRVPAALALVPWELLCDPRDEQFLVLAPDLALIRYPELPAPITPLRIDGQLQVVVVLASPNDRDYGRINVDRELRRIEAALKLPRERGQIALEVIRGRGTLDQLRARLRRPAHVLHILSHGHLDEASGEGVLIFEDADGAAEPVNAELLRQYLLRQRGQTRLVLLNACLGALPAGDDPFGSLGVALLRGGVPAVIAMQFELAEDAAAELARVFYAELAAGAPVDLALSEARLHLYGRYATRLDWVVPVLFMRSEDGALFVLEDEGRTLRHGSGQATKDEGRKTEPASASWQLALPSVDPAELAKLWQRAQVAYFTRRWAEAAELCRQVAAIDPQYQDVAAKLTEARRQVELLAIYQQARELRAAGQSAAVLGALDELAGRQPGYPDPDGLRDWALAQRRRDELYAQALGACGQGDWAGALPALEQLLADFPDDADAQALLDQARAEAAEAAVVAEQARRAAEAAERQEAAAREQQRRRREEREQQVRETRARAFRERFGAVQIQIEAGNAAKALDLLEALLKQQPDDREAVGLVAPLIENPNVPLEQRLRAARLAGQYGDPRPGVCTLPDGLADQYWCGPFPAREYPIADGQARVRLGEFRVARYAVTVWQFRQFWEDPAGYENQIHWPKQGWTWKQQEPVTRKPYLWDDPDWTAANQPVVGVSWYEAAAFCRWLTQRGQTEGWLPADLAIRLPSEAEWEVAAMWDAARGAMRAWQPPTGEPWQNAEETGIGRSAPVGLFPQGASPCGVLDMAGNIWEWCGSHHEDFPKQAATLRDDFPTRQYGPALRGGAYYLQNERSGWGARGGYAPDDRSSYCGFRVVVCSAPRG